MKKEEIITRNHNFENKLTYVKRVGKRYELSHEKSIRPLILAETPELKKAFESENWEVLESIEGEQY